MSYSSSTGTFTADATYIQNGDEDGANAFIDIFKYKAYDGVDSSNLATATITCTASNDVPVAETVTGSGSSGNEKIKSIDIAII